jgi:hypothetical protein
VGVTNEQIMAFLQEWRADACGNGHDFEETSDSKRLYCKRCGAMIDLSKPPIGFMPGASNCSGRQDACPTLTKRSVTSVAEKRDG